MTGSPKRGRPAEASADVVALTALRLFDRRGFDAVTMDEIALACGVSRRTLFRLFPSKNDIVWGGAQQALERFAGALEAVPDSATPTTLAELLALIGAVSFEPLDDPSVLEATRRRLRLIGSVPALIGHGTPHLDTGRDLLARVLAARNVMTLPPLLLAQVLTSALFSAVLWWAEHGDEETTPADVIRKVLSTFSA